MTQPEHTDVEAVAILRQLDMMDCGAIGMHVERTVYTFGTHKGICYAADNGWRFVVEFRRHKWFVIDQVVIPVVVDETEPRRELKLDYGELPSQVRWQWRPSDPQRWGVREGGMLMWIRGVGRTGFDVLRLMKYTALCWIDGKKGRSQ